jgi:hypothetical protein
MGLDAYHTCGLVQPVPKALGPPWLSFVKIGGIMKAESWDVQVQGESSC